jgi:ATP-dependent RNA helicase DeaD
MMRAALFPDPRPDVAVNARMLPMPDTLPIDTATETVTFQDLGLIAPLLKALDRLGYASPTPIQARTIPALLEGRDVLGQAQTGTGKTAAFALPILQQIDFADRSVQALVLVPTRELALQVAEAIHEYGKDLGNVGVLPIYGGDPIGRQLSRLEGAVRIVVGTPGRVLDHLGRGSLRLDKVKVAVLDEADEMLRMGFVDDVEQILGQMPASKQTTLFSATLPDAIARIANKYLRDPERIAVAAQTRTVATVDQRFMIVQPHERLEALARLLTVEDIDAALVFARTRAGCAELSEMLEGRGFASEAMHGDMAQSARASVIRRLKNGQLRIVVATDVAARGLDVDQINLVVNMEMPGEAETYVHRIGRTGRAGRTGRSVQFVMPREERRLRDLERFTGQRLLQLPVPTERDVQAARTGRFLAHVEKTLDTVDLTAFRPMVADLLNGERNLEDVAAALARLAWGDKPLPTLATGMPMSKPAVVKPIARPVVEPKAVVEPKLVVEPKPAAESKPVVERKAAKKLEPTIAPAAVEAMLPEVETPRPERVKPAARKEKVVEVPVPTQPPVEELRAHAQAGVTSVWLSLGVGRRNGVQPRDIVGAIANEAGVPGPSVGAIDIRENFSLVELPVDLVPPVLDRMRKAMICGRYLNIRVVPPGDSLETPPPPPPVPTRPSATRPRTTVRPSAPQEAGETRPRRVTRPRS